MNWPGVRDELRPKVEAAASQDAARAVIREMLSRLGQSHFLLLSASADDALPGPASVPVDIRIGSGSIIVTRVAGGSSAGRAGLRAGATILSVDGTPADTWFAAAVSTDVRVRNMEVWRRAYRALHGATGSMAHLGVRLPDRAEGNVTVAREIESGDVVSLGNLPPMHVRTDVRSVLTPTGRVRKLYLDARNGAVLKIKDD